MVLAQHLKDVQYANQYKAAKRKGDFIMLDNGAAEGEMVSISWLKEMAELIDADEIVMPDALRDSNKSIQLYAQHHSAFPSNKKVVIVHGTSTDEMVACLRSYMTINPGFTTVGIPKYSYAFSTREEITKKVIQAAGHLYNIHWFGIYSNPFKEVIAAKQSGARSIDSGAAVAYAQHGIDISSDIHAPLLWDVKYSESIAHANILRLQECAYEGSV